MKDELDGVVQSTCCFLVGLDENESRLKEALAYAYAFAQIIS